MNLEDLPELHPSILQTIEIFVMAEKERRLVTKILWTNSKSIRSEGKQFLKKEASIFHHRAHDGKPKKRGNQKKKLKKAFKR